MTPSTEYTSRTRSWYICLLAVVFLLIGPPLAASTYQIEGVVVKVDDNGFYVFVTKNHVSYKKISFGDVVFIASKPARRKQPAIYLPSSYVIDGHAIDHRSALVPGRHFLLYAKEGGVAAATCAHDGQYGYVEAVNDNTVSLTALPHRPEIADQTIDANATFILDGKPATKAALQPGAWVSVAPRCSLQVFAYRAIPSITNLGEVYQHTRQGLITATGADGGFSIAAVGEKEPQQIPGGKASYIGSVKVGRDAVQPGRQVLGWCNRKRTKPGFVLLSHDLVSQGRCEKLSGNELVMVDSAGKSMSITLPGDTRFHLDGKPVKNLSAASYAWVQVVQGQKQRWTVRHFPLQDLSVADAITVIEDKGSNQRLPAVRQLGRLTYRLDSKEHLAVLAALPLAVDAQHPELCYAVGEVFAKIGAHYGKEKTMVTAISDGGMACLEAFGKGLHSKDEKILGANYYFTQAVLVDKAAPDRLRDRVKAIGLDTSKAFKKWYGK